MKDSTDCITESIIDSINKHKMVDISDCTDDKDNVKLGDSVAMLWFNDPNYYAGRLEDINGQLGISIGKNIVGYVDDAHHVVKLNKVSGKISIDKDNILNELIKDLKNIVSVIDKSKVDIPMKVDFFRLFYEGWEFGEETILISVGLRPRDFRNSLVNNLSRILNGVELGEYSPSEGWHQITKIVEK